MAMRFKYTQVPTSQPVPALGGRMSIPWPIVTVTVIGPQHSQALPVKIDSACDGTLFPEDLAAKLGIDLTNAETGQSFAANQGVMVVRFAQVVLRVTDGIEYREWPAKVGFTPLLRRPLAGFGGFMQFFKTTFYGDIEEFELEVNSLYPGT